MLVREIMSKVILSVGPDETVEKAAAHMIDNRVGCLLIMSKGTLLGIVTERDVLRYVGVQSQVGDALVSDIMRTSVYSISPQKSLVAAIKLMKKHKIKKLPVIDGRKIVGIVTATDIIFHVPSHIKELKSLFKGVH